MFLKRIYRNPDVCCCGTVVYRGVSGSLVFDFLLDILTGLLRDEAHQVLHALRPDQEVHQLVVLRFTLLQDVLLVHHLPQGHILFVQERVDVRGRVQVKLPKHGSSVDQRHDTQSASHCWSLTLTYSFITHQ